MSQERFDAWLDNGSTAWLEGNARPLSVVLKAVDPHAYELLYLDWLDPENDTED